MKKFGYFILSLFILLAGCSGTKKDVLVMASGQLTINGTNITLEPGLRHNEEKMIVDNNKITIQRPDSKTEITSNEGPGLYILNLKKDTLVGSYQRIGEQAGQERITQEDLRNRLDSLQQLTKGANTNFSRKNFCIAPNQLVRISENPNAQVVGPYMKMPQSFAAGKEHEVYKFYTNKEMYEIIEKLRPMIGDTLQKK
ncbi:MAG TPA: hypothetical protein VM012_11785 [Flavitalea sp.]|nr:hypothetical protein [Flavitalea sp.]